MLAEHGRGEEEAEVLNIFFTSVFNSHISYPWGTHPPEAEEKDRE